MLTTPFILFKLGRPCKCNEIIDHFRNSCVFANGIGHVCKYSLFDFTISTAVTSPVSELSSQKREPAIQPDDDNYKLEKSFLNFKLNYPQWNVQQSSTHCKGGAELLQRLIKFEKSRLPPLQHPTDAPPSSFVAKESNVRSGEVPFFANNKSIIESMLATSNNQHKNNNHGDELELTKNNTLAQDSIFQTIGTSSYGTSTTTSGQNNELFVLLHEFYQTNILSNQRL